MSINFFGEEVPEPTKVSALRLSTPKQPEPKKIRVWSGNPKGLRQDQMDSEDKKLYARESKKAQHRREAEEQAEKELTRASQQQIDYEEYGARSLEQGIPYPTLKQEMEISGEANKLICKVLDEVGKDPDVDRIDDDTVRTVAALNLGFTKGYVEANPSGLHVGFRFVDLAMSDIIARVHSPVPSRIPRHDVPWNTSPAFLAAYRTALKQSLDICDKYPQLVEKNYVSIIKNEWTRVCGEGL
jgi:hypothetical protein